MEKLLYHPGLRHLRKELRSRMPTAEVALWQQLRNKARGVKFRRQTSIGNFIVDFYCAEARVVIELDGDSHYEGDAPHYDTKRDTELTRIGFRVLRFTNLEIVDDLERVLIDIDRAVSEAPPPTPPR